MLEMLDGCLEAIHQTASERGGTYTRSEHEALQHLVDLRQDCYSKVSPMSHPNKRPAPPPPNVCFFFNIFTSEYLILKKNK